MYDICLFSGTTEGRELAAFLARTPLNVLVCVATEYGEALSPKADNLHVMTGRLNEADMAALFAREQFALVVDATHPHATAVTENIQNAARVQGLTCLRLLREPANAQADITYVHSIHQAAEHLKKAQGRVLITTGSKELSPYQTIPDYQRRLFVRVLPTKEALQACADCGIPAKNILAMHGPFSEAMNRAILVDHHISILVTKESGSAGGFTEKLSAAQAEGVHTLVIGRPPQVEGLHMAEAIQHIKARFHLDAKPMIRLVGMGMGTPETLTGQAYAAISEADCLIGAGRLLEGYRSEKRCFEAVAPENILSILRKYPSYQRPAVLLSGDVGFYSGAKKLLPLLKEYEVALIPGISSLQALCAKAGVSWEDAHCVSLHGRKANIASAVSSHAKVFALVGGADGARALCQQLCEAGFGAVIVHVGERIGYPDQRLTTGTAERLRHQQFDSLSALLIENPEARATQSPHLPDEAFIRQTEDKLIPMTKAEVRAVSVCKLRLPIDAVVYDVGAGTGSVSVELARSCPEGQVYAIEQNPQAVSLIQENARQHHCFNLRVISGVAPDAFRDLPPPSHAFIGGSGGHMEEILRMLVKKNHQVRIVINLIALESISEALRCVKALGFSTCEIVQLQVSRARSLANYHLLTAQNPVTVMTCQNIKEPDSHETRH